MRRPHNDLYLVVRTFLANGIMNGMKTCSKCGETKPLETFGKRAANHDGYDGRCKTCVSAYSAAHYQNNKSKRQKQQKAWYEANKDRFAVQSKQYYEANKEHKNAQRRIRYVSNRESELAKNAEYRAKNHATLRAKDREYYQNNKAAWLGYVAQRRSVKLQRTPAWADKERIQAYYDVCAFFNEVNGYAKYHVDHVIPLQGKTVSGLHVHNNLQVITADENLRKGAKHG